MLNGYNRNATIVGNEFAWVGATCVASWGYSSTCFNGNCSFKLPWREGPDARGGEQPRGTRVLNNLFREMGIFQKQASAYFHAKSGLAEVAGNVVFNGPRAMFNLNDGMIGGDNIHGNLLANAVLLKAAITAFPSVSLPFLAVPLRSQRTLGRQRAGSTHLRAGRVKDRQPAGRTPRKGTVLLHRLLVWEHGRRKERGRTT